jgi:anti-anti-sigma factor
MISTDLSICGCDGHVVVTLHGELDLVDATYVAAVLTAVANREPEIIMDLAGLKFIDARGVAALARGRKQARQAGGDLLLAAPQQGVRGFSPSLAWPMPSRFMPAWKGRPAVPEAPGERLR